MSARTVAFFSCQWVGHIRRQLPLIERVVATGATAYVFTVTEFRELVEAAGGVFVDLFGRHPLAEADDVSLPRPIRYVTWAGLHAEDAAAELRERGVDLVVYDTFTPVGRAAAVALGLPYVNVVAGHGIDPERPADFCTLEESDPRRHADERCLRACEVLRERYGFEDASPFSYLSALSPHLNIVCEPPEFVRDDLRRKLEPVAFVGSLPDDPPPPNGAPAPDVYVSLGTISWRYYRPGVLDVLQAFSAALGRREDLRALVSLGQLELAPEEAAALRRPNVAVEPWVDQWGVLANAPRAFVTHHGMNSSHEAVWHGVPMIGWPVLGDQPAMAATCARLGVSHLLGEGRQPAVDEAAADAALDAVLARGEEMRAALAAERCHEERVMADRSEVVRQMLELT